MKTFVYNVYDSISEEYYRDEIVAESIAEAEEIMEMRYDVKFYFWKVIDIVEL